MPIKECTLPGGGSGYQWGSGTCYADRAEAERQAAAAHANGYVGDSAMAFDKSVRAYDVDGRLQVEWANISKAMVCPYFGQEIPNAEAMGLELSKVYYLLRDPDELAKAAPSFRNLPLLLAHSPVSAAQPRKDLVVGSTGSDVEFVAPYLRCSLSVWDGAAIAGIESGKQMQLSSGYRYRADMTPGKFEGVAYDGVMRDIVGNHVALVEVGRAGADVVVGDAQPFNVEKETVMKKVHPKARVLAAALRAYVTPKLAQDAALGSLYPVVGKVGAKGFDPKEITSAMAAHTKGKLAQDANLDDLPALLARMALDEDEDMQAKDEPDLEDETEEEKKKRLEAEARATDGLCDDDDEKVTKPAMDAAIAAAVAKATTQARADAEALHTAREEVMPLVGKVAMDSAEAVYRFALDHAGVENKEIHASALRPMVQLLLARPANQQKEHLAMDAKVGADVAKRFPAISRFKHA